MDIVEEFVKNKRGKATSKSWLKKFFKTNGIENPNTYFEQKRNYDEDIITYANEINTYAPMARRCALSTVKNLLQFNNIRLQPKTEYQIKELCKGPKATAKEHIPTRAELKEILADGRVGHKALFLTMLSAGLRAGEVVGIKVDDVHLNETPVRIEVPWESTRTKQSRVTFASAEAKHYINQWLKVREQYLKGNRNAAPINDTRMFPFTTATLRGMWNLLLKKSGYDMLDTRATIHKKRHQITPQKLRKFFKSQLSNAGVPFEVVEALMGHTEGISAVYRRYTEKQLKEWYTKGEEAVLIFERPVNQDAIDNLQSQVQTLNGQMGEILEFQKRVTPTKEVLDEDGDPILDDNFEPVEVPIDIPKEAIITAYQLEKERKKEVNELAKKLDVDFETALAIFNLKKKK